MDIEKISEIIALFEKSKLQRLSLKKDDFEIILEKGGKIPTVEKVFKKEEIQAEREEDENIVFVEAPMVGTFYHAASPDSEPFVKVGDEISEDSIVCIIEAMKVMNEVKAGVKGIVKEVILKDIQPVEFGTKLFKVERI